MGGPTVDAILGDLLNAFSGSLGSGAEEDWDLQRRLAVQVAQLENDTLATASLAARGALARMQFAQEAVNA
eukprot:CAMPEP_0168486802 /NCGR_PEP_ID=MMETSP0228-20121227/67309_1 /TAXON_ID=133427 /ORGANISM="Protoceratium reticulatum, Strain CCCM 535 (=CCMP 1889)" /LENGTH=70 /DNA_ID=CAMNT_0008503401 /DNA_START=3 /DNA_END=212 /DNA_ORIENTATION=+